MTMRTTTSALTPRLFFSRSRFSWVSVCFAILWLSLQGGVVSASPLPNFPDTNLQACFDEQVAAQGWLNAEDVQELVCVERGIRDFYGIDQLTALASLDLSGNLIDNLYPLGYTGWPALPNLVSLRLADNAIVDLYPLQAYTALQTLWLSGNPGIDFQQLRPIIEQNPNLTRLGLGDIDLQEPGLPWLYIDTASVVELDISNTGIEGLWGIESYASLEVLDASDNRIVDIFPLYMTSSFDRLRELNLANNRIVDVIPLHHYTELRSLWLSGNSGIDFQQLYPIIEQNQQLIRLGLGDIDLQEPGLPWFNFNPSALVELDVSNTGIEGLWGIEGYVSLQKLDASDNRIFEIYPLDMLSWFDNLRELNLANNRIVDVMPLQGHTELRSLWLSGNSGIDFYQLFPIIEQNPQLVRLGLGDINLQEPGLPWFNINTEAVVELDLSNTGIEWLWGIEGYTSLQKLDASNNRIFELYPLDMLSWIDNLRELNLANNRIVDVNPLQNYTGLRTLWLSGNSGIDFQQLRPIVEQNQQLTRLGLGDIDFQEPGLPWFNINTEAVIELDVSHTGIEWLWGIEGYKSLQMLDASDNRIFDLYPLDMLSWSGKLRELNLADNQIVDVYPLQGYTGLRSLWLSGNSDIDIDQLRPIIEQNKDLTRLGLGGIDLREMAVPWFDINMEAVVELDLSHTGIEWLWGIEGYTSLQVLDASDNQIFDLYPLEMLSWFGKLRELNLANNQIVDVTALQGYTGLRTLWLSGNAGIDFQQLRPIIEQNPQLTRLGLGDIDLQEPAVPWFNINMEAVVELDLSHTGIEWLWGIEGYTSLQVLDASDNQIFDLYPLEMLSWLGKLRELNLGDNQIIDVTPLQAYTGLRTLWLSGNAGIDFQQLRPIIEQNQQLTRLGLGDIDLQEPGLPWFNIDTETVVELDVSHTGIEGLWGIESYKSLQVLDASANSLFDIWPLFYVPELESVDLRDITTIPCDQLDQLELILGADAVLRPATCVL
jgi:Leucine-rich repeat (LRR) protein